MQTVALVLPAVFAAAPSGFAVAVGVPAVFSAQAIAFGVAVVVFQCVVVVVGSDVLVVLNVVPVHHVCIAWTDHRPWEGQEEG